MYQIKIRKTGEGKLIEIGRANNIEKAYNLFKEITELEEVYLKYYEFEKEIQ